MNRRELLRGLAVAPVGTLMYDQLDWLIRQPTSIITPFSRIELINSDTWDELTLKIGDQAYEVKGDHILIPVAANRKYHVYMELLAGHGRGVWNETQKLPHSFYVCLNPGIDTVTLPKAREILPPPVEPNWQKPSTEEFKRFERWQGHAWRDEEARKKMGETHCLGARLGRPRHTPFIHERQLRTVERLR